MLRFLENIKTAVEAVSSIITGGRLPVTLGTSPTIDIGDVTIKDHDGTDGAAVNASNELQVRDDDANTDLDTIAADLNELTAAPVEKTPAVVVQAITTPSTAEALVGSETFARAVYLQARKVAGDNTGNVFVGLSDLDQGVAELFELTPGSTCEIVMPSGTKIDLNDIYIDADTAVDGVVGWYIPV